jgi:hypothetical protein
MWGWFVEGEIVGSSKQFIEVKTKAKWCAAACLMISDCGMSHIGYALLIPCLFGPQWPPPTEERAAPSDDQPTTYEARDQDRVTLSSGDINDHSDSPTMARSSSAPLSGTTDATRRQADFALLLTVASSCQFISCVSYQFSSAGFQRRLARWMACGAQWVHKHLY